MDIIDHDLPIPSLAGSDQVTVEIASDTSFDTFNLSGGVLAGNLQVSFQNGFTPTLGQTYQVLTSSEPLTGDFANYEGLGFFDGNYLKPVVNGNSLYLEVAKLPGGALTSSVIDAITAFAGGSVALSIDSPGVFSVTLSNATASAELEFSDDQFTIVSASITANKTFKIGSLFEVEGATVTVENFSISAAGVGTGTFSIGAAKATLFPGKAFSAAVEDFEFTFNTETSSFDVTVGSFELAVGEALKVTATSEDPETPAASFSYNPDTIDEPGTEIGTISSLTVTIPKLAGFTGTINDLVIRNDGFSFADATITVPGTYKIGSLAEVTGPSLTVSDVDVDFSNLAPFTGSITLAVASFTLFPGNSKFTASADNLAVTFDFSEGKNGAMTLTADAVKLTLNPSLEFTVGDLTIDASATGTDPIATIGSVAVNLKSAGITGTGGNFQILADGSFQAMAGFGVELSVNTADPDAFKWPKWLPIQIQSIGLEWADPNVDPNDFTLSLSAEINTGASLPMTIEGGIEEIVIDVNNLAAGEFPIISIEGASVRVKGNLFGYGIDAGLILGIVRVDGNNELINDDRMLLDDDLLPTTESTADPELDDTLFYGAFEAGIEIADKGFNIKVGLSEIGPLSIFISASIPIVIEPVSGLALSNFRGGISFGDPIDSITDPKELADAEFTPVGDLSLEQWENQLKHQVAGQAGSLVTWENLGSIDPADVRITAGATLSSAYATDTAFHADVDITADLTGKFILNVAGAFAADTIDLNFRAYVDLSAIDQGDAAILFFTNLMPISAGATTAADSPIAVYGGVEFHYFDGDGEEMTGLTEEELAALAEEDKAQRVQIIVSGGAEFKLLSEFSATLTGEVTVDLDFDDTVLTIDMIGDLEATYIGEIADAAGHFVIDFDVEAPEIPIIYGALEVNSGEAFEKLEEIGIQTSAKGWVYINTDTEDHTVTVSISETETKDIELNALSAGLGVYGTLTWDAFGANWLTMVGLLDVRVSGEDGAELFLNATLLVGPTGSEILIMNSRGLLIANEDGVAGMLELTRDQTRSDIFGTGVGTTFSQNTTFVLVFNTTGENQSYELSDGITIPGIDSNLITVPGGPPPEGTPGSATTWDQATNEAYFVIHASGAMHFLDDALVVSGDFNMLIKADHIDMMISAQVSVFGSNMAISGHAIITSSSFISDVDATLAVLYPDAGFEIQAAFTLYINTATNEYYIAVTNARVNLFGLVMTGGFKIGIDPSGQFSITIPDTTPLSLNFFDIVNLKVYGNLSTSGVFSFTAAADASYNYTAAQRAKFSDDLDVGISGALSVTFSNSGFAGTIFGGVQVYGEDVASITGSLAITDSQMILSFTAHITITPEFTVDLPPINIYYPDPTWDDPFRWSLAYSYDPAPYTVPALKADVSFDLTLGGVTAPKAPPQPEIVLAHKGTGDTSSVLYLNMGTDAALRLQYKTDNGETFVVAHESGTVGNETVTVTSFGKTQTYTGVSKIVVTDAGEGGDNVTIKSGVLADAEMHGGNGADRLTYEGSGKGTLYGDAGTDILTGSSGQDTLYGGADNDSLNGGGGSDNLYGEGGDDQLQGGAGNDFLYGGIENDILRGGDDDDYLQGGLGSDQNFGENGNDSIVWSIGEGSDTRAMGGTGTDTFTVTGSSAAETVTVGAATDSQSFTVNFAGTSLTGGTAIENMVLDMQGGADAVTINDTSSALFQNLSHVTLKLGTDTAADSVVVNASNGVDTFYLSSTSGVVNIDRGVGVFNGSPVQLGLSTSIEQGANGADTLLLNLGANDDIAYVKSTLAGLQTTIDGGTQRTQIRVGSQADSSTGNLNGIAGKLVVTGGSGNEDALYLYDQTDSVANTGALTSSLITGLGMGANGISYSGFESLNVNLGSGGDTVNVQSTSTATTNVRTGLGNDTINVDSNAPAANGNVNAIVGRLVIDGQGGSDTLKVEDTGDATANGGVLTATTVTGLGMGTGITYGALEALNISLGAGGNTFNVQGTATGTATTLNSGNGNDVLTIDSNGASANGTVNDVVSSLTINGQGGFNRLTMEDYSDSTGDMVHVTPTQIGATSGDTFFGTGGLLNYTGLNQITLNMSQAYTPDTIYLTPSRVTEFFIRGRDPQTPLQRAQLGGDALYLDFTGLTAAERLATRLNATGLNDPADPLFNTWNISGYGKVNYKQIEQLNHVQTLAVAYDLGGNEPRVTVIDAETGLEKFSFLAFNAGFKGGVRVAVGDVNGDGIPDIVVSAGPGGGSEVRVFNGATGLRFAGSLGSFFAFQGNNTSVFVAVGDVNLDGLADIITGSESGDPIVKVFDAYKLLTGQANPVISQFTAYDRHITSGARVAVGDVTGDGVLDIITGPASGLKSEVRVFKTTLSANQATVSHSLLTSFNAFPKYNGPINLAVSDLNGDGRADIVVSTDGGGSSLVRIYSGATIAAGTTPTLFVEFAPYDKQAGGVRLALVDLNGDGIDELITASSLVGSKVKTKAWSILPDGSTRLKLVAINTYFASRATDPRFQGSLFLAGGN